MNWLALLASMLVSAGSQYSAQKSGEREMALANTRKKGEQDKINEIMRQNLLQYEAGNEQQAKTDIVQEKVTAANKAIDSTTNFQDVNKYGTDGSVKNTAFQDALTGAIAKVAGAAKTKAGLKAKISAPLMMRGDQSVASADAMQRQGIIGKNATDYWNNVSRINIEKAYQPNPLAMILSKALGAYATGGASLGGGTKKASTAVAPFIQTTLPPSLRGTEEKKPPQLFRR
jgi:hypothetical protein